MKYLTKIQFNSFYDSLDFVISCDFASVHDEVGDFANYTSVSNHWECQEVIIDGIEYALTDAQEHEIYKEVLRLVYSAKTDRDNAFNDEDFTHFSNIIYK